MKLRRDDSVDENALCLMKCQEEDRALWVLNFGWEGEEGWDEGEILRFFDGGAFFPSAAVVKMKQPSKKLSQMDKLLSSRFNHESLRGDYICPPESRPGDLKIPFGSNISVIDLREAENGDRINTIQKIIKAYEEFGFFQVINHGIFENVMNEARCVFKELFETLAEEKQKLCSNDPSECVGSFSVEVKKLASRILSLISEGLGLECGYFENP
ncbi:hypothetical protein V8G54_004528 [Vigna mungo]|uniref:Non-haem dioxygenase N-terminal domain-containing protein n=1 Tax=Vigna mungo TaxID=3915 RepID=A0AAQ3SFY0_VIGMU